MPTEQPSLDEFNAQSVVYVVDTPVGKGLTAARPFPPQAIIGEIRGTLSDDPNSADEYTFDMEHGWQLDPAPPFRFLNHSCRPNCEIDLLDQPADQDGPDRRALFLVALRVIQSGEPLTIDYNWPADYALECRCGEPDCRGWIVAKEELDRVRPEG